MWTIEVILDELEELRSIDHELTAIEHQYGPCDDVADARRRHRWLCDHYLNLLWALVSADARMERVH